MRQDKRVTALLFIRKLRGGSQPILVRANDGFFYVVKFLNNPQGSNLLFNEALGTEIFRGAGLPVPEWCPVCIFEEFLDRNPECWMETEHGRRRPQAGWCFGSRFLSLRNSSAFEIISGQSFSRIGNRKDFWTAWVLDTLCGHADNRQAIFLERDSRRLEAFFIDHGHLFGGALGTGSPSFLASRYLDPRIYAKPTAADAEDILRIVQEVDLAAISHVANNLPDGWSTEKALQNFNRFKHRVADAALLKNAVRFIVGMVEDSGESHEQKQTQSTTEYRCSNLYGQISPAGFDDRVDRGGGDFAGHPRLGRLEVMHPPCLHAAGF